MYIYSTLVLMLSLILDFLLLAIGRKLLRENYSVSTNFRLELVEPSARVVEIRQFFEILRLSESR